MPAPRIRYTWTMRRIPARELRDQFARTLRSVEAGEPVADLAPIQTARRRFVPRAEIVHLLDELQNDPAFLKDINEAAGARISGL